MPGRPVIVAKLVGYISGAEVALYVATRGFTTKPTDTPADQHFKPVLAKAASIRRDCWDMLTVGGRSRVGFGEGTLRNVAPDKEAAGILDYLIDHAFDGRSYEQWYGLDDAAFPSGFTQITRATMKNLRLSRTAATPVLRDRQAEADLDLQPNKYAGSNVLPDGLEGGAELKDKPKPWCFGQVFNVPAVCVNTSKLIYQVHDGAVSSISDVRDGGVSLGLGPTSWAAKTSQFGADSIFNIAYGNGILVAVGTSGKISSSTDGGLTWTARTSGFGANTVRNVVYVEATGLFIATGGDAALTHKTVASSPDGVTWTLRTTADVNGANGAAYGAGVYVVCCDGGVIQSSPDLVTWTTHASGFGASNITGVVFAQSTFTAVGLNEKISRSTDGLTWTLRTGTLYSTGATQYLNDVRYSDQLGLYLIRSSPEPVLFVSADGLQWTPRAVAFRSDAKGITDIAEGQGVIVLSFATGGISISYDGGLGWLDYSVGFGTTAMYALGYDASVGRFVVAGASGDLAISAINGTYASLADLQDDALEPAPGTVKTWLAGGMFRLGSPPAAQITADVTQGSNAAARTGGQFFATLMVQAGLGSDYSTADVAVMDGKNTAVLGFWQGTAPVKVAAVLDALGDTLGAWWAPDRLGQFRFKRLEDPATQSPSYTLYAYDFVKPLDLRTANDDNEGVPPFKTTLRYLRNYLPQTEVAGVVTAADRLLYSQEWQSTSSTDASVSATHPLSRERVVDTLFTVKADADTEAARRQTLHGTKRKPLESAVRLDATRLGIDLGDIVEVIHPRFGLSGGMNFSVMMQEAVHDPDKKYINLGIWG
jgi:hypothetical protein